MCVCVCVYVCVCVLDREWSRAVANRALVVVLMTMYLTGYSNCLLSVNHFAFCHTSFKKV